MGKNEDLFLDKINDIKKALNVEAYQSALALSLSLIDICKNIENSIENTKLSYSGWYDKWFNNLINTETKEKIVSTAFTGDMCWGLRCAFLHSGNIKDKRLEYKFKLQIAKNNFSKNYLYGAHKFGEPIMVNGEKRYRDIRIDVGQFCINVCNAALVFYYRNKDNKNNIYVFNSHGIDFVKI